MKHIKKFKELASKGALAAIMATGLTGCNTGQSEQANTAVVKQNATVFIEKTDRGYKIADEFPSNETRVFLREKDAEGRMNERLLSQAEIDKLLREENAKIDAGTSNLTNGNAQMSSGGMSLGEAILASAAGAIIGSWIGSKLFGSPGYNAARQGAYSNPSAYSRSQSSFGGAKTGAASSGAKSGFFGGNKAASAAGSSAGG
ncbi:MAG: UPF0323 family lipoprotein [Campylobacter sp.]|uniref:UPF0323 family lipoprotein n=1 Tax=Campylobacter sp. TaxID=205 RepID=UPI002A7626BC|nr:UPF0323 family lipoprotein [Campylobacter sp.]MCI7362650.1 UPF0323 family lipoprotein [Campylobacter sp.]MDY3246524.1 UPF0323 family lipoprotein [Campylobacter sp.]MDY4860310.1 UPF0323 family lipoprotein [Campylobacter sp.]MDY5116102.1 UPF0323 family lipoprotein [Campylobacter sp.]MDY5466467.1 UPF0323 family lipoprotein [Campylobacter sp.]